MTSVTAGLTAGRAINLDLVRRKASRAADAHRRQCKQLAYAGHFNVRAAATRALTSLSVRFAERRLRSTSAMLDCDNRHIRRTRRAAESL
jgi:hypothetical protein